MAHPAELRILAELLSVYTNGINVSAEFFVLQVWKITMQKNKEKTIFELFNSNPMNTFKNEKFTWDQAHIKN